MAEDTSAPALRVNDHEGAVEETQVAKLVRSKDYISVYANFAQCGFTAWDIRINFGLVGTSETGEPTMTEEVAVMVSPAMAKALVSVLNGNVKAYEQINGPIQLPQSVVQESARRVAISKGKGQPVVKTAPEAKPKE